MVELITVMIILGILSAVAIPRLIGGNDMASRNFRTDVQSALRYAQKASTSHRRLVCATVSAKSVTLQISSINPSSTCDTNLANPAGQNYSTDDANVAAGGLSGTLFFQPWGRITTDGAGNTIASGSITITGADPVTIDGATGYVE